GDCGLNVQVESRSHPPQVVSTNPQDGATFDAPPVRLTVQFSEPVNLQPLAFYSAVHGTAGTLASVYIQGSAGERIHPRLESYEATTNQATFLMLDGLCNDSYEFHLSPALGIAALPGNALV